MDTSGGNKRSREDGLRLGGQTFCRKRSSRSLDLDLRRLVAQARDSERLARHPRRRPSQACTGREREREEDERTGLVRRGQVNRDEVQQRRDAEGDLEQGHVQGALDQAVGRRGQLGPDVRSSRVQEEGHDRGERRVGLQQGCQTP